MALTRTLKKYPEKECWDKYMSWGAAASHLKLRQWLRTEKGLDITKQGMGAFWAMWRYALRHPEECFPQYRKWYFESASKEGVESNVSFRDFLEKIKKQGKIGAVDRKELARFCEKYNLSIS